MSIVTDRHVAADRDVEWICSQILPTHSDLNRIRSGVGAANVWEHDLAGSSFCDCPVVIGVLNRIHRLRNRETRAGAEHDWNIRIMSLIVVVLVALIEEIQM